MNASLPSNWKTWVLNALLKGTPSAEIMRSLLEKGFTYEQVKSALGNNIKASHEIIKSPAFYRKLSDPTLVQNIANTRARYLENELAQIIQLDDFLFPEQCEQLISLSSQKLERSKVASKDGYSTHRTSSTCELSSFNNQFVAQLNQHIVNTLGVDVGDNETIQAQHYAVGQEFKLHSDYFEPASEGWELQGKTRGQRTWTFMIYLNGKCTGGETEFPKLGIKVSPKAGRALIWNNLYPNGTPNPHTMHKSNPVTKGEKVIITKWFRDQQQ
jgi:prolyl 4-hydroxylase